MGFNYTYCYSGSVNSTIGCRTCSNCSGKCSSANSTLSGLGYFTNFTCLDQYNLTCPFSQDITEQATIYPCNKDIFGYSATCC